MSASIYIAMPAFGHENSSHTTASLVALTKELAEHQMLDGFSALSFPDIVDLRNLFLTVWYDTLKSSHLLFVDADMGFEPPLIWDMLKADKPLVGCIYPKKRLPVSWVGSSLTPPTEPDESGLLELEGVGCGVMLIRRDCIDAMIRTGAAEIETELGETAIGDTIRARGGSRVIQAFDKLRVGRRNLSEDLSFCHRHRQAGGKVYAVTRHTLCHVGPHQYAARYSDLYEQLPAIEQSAA